jgi:hypothetical protein
MKKNLSSEKLPWRKNDGLKLLGYSLAIFCVFMSILWLRDCYVEEKILKEYKTDRDKDETLFEALSKGKKVV